jgi:hypothetical protein
MTLTPSLNSNQYSQLSFNHLLEERNSSYKDLLPNPLSNVQFQEYKSFDLVTHTLTNGFAKAAGLKRTNLGNCIKLLERKGVIPKRKFEFVKDPHSKKQRVACNDHKMLLSRAPDIEDFYFGIGRPKAWIENILDTMNFSAVYYKYATLLGIEYSPIVGFLFNVNNSRALRDMGRKDLRAVPTTKLLLNETTN